MTFTRRRFLGSTAAAAGLCSLGGGLSFLSNAGEAAGTGSSGSGSGRSLLAVQLAGGNDGLNTIVPAADPLYRTLRPTVGLGEAELLPVDGRIAFHTALAPLRERFTAGGVAVVQGVGYPRPDRSHFVSTAIWQTGRLEPYRDPAGWLGRAIEEDESARRPRGAEPLVALGIGGGGLTPALYATARPVPSLLSLDAFTVQPDRRYPADAPALRKAVDALYTPPSGRSPAPGDRSRIERFVKDVGGTALTSSDTLRAAAAGYVSSVSYPRGVFGDQLKLVAQLLTTGIGTRVFHVTLGGFDTHANQKAQQRSLLGQLADGICALLDDLGRAGCGDSLAVMTYSEFGRRARENGSAGTDHGSAGPLFVVGERVAGGVYGPVPDLSALEGGDVPFAVDFRTVYASVLRDWLGIPPARVLGSDFGGLRLFRA